MPLYQLTITAANAVVGADLIEKAAEQFKPTRNVSTRGRRIYRAAMAGSTAAGDTAIHLTAAGKPVAKLYNTSTGFVTTKDEIFPIGATIPQGADFKAEVVDAAATNDVHLLLFMDE